MDLDSFLTAPVTAAAGAARRYPARHRRRRRRAHPRRQPRPDGNFIVDPDGAEEFHRQPPALPLLRGLRQTNSAPSPAAYEQVIGSAHKLGGRIEARSRRSSSAPTRSKPTSSRQRPALRRARHRSCRGRRLVLPRPHPGAGLGCLLPRRQLQARPEGGLAGVHRTSSSTSSPPARGSRHIVASRSPTVLAEIRARAPRALLLLSVPDGGDLPAVAGRRAAAADDRRSSPCGNRWSISR